MGEAREEPLDHALGKFEPYPAYAIEGLPFGGLPQPNTLGAL